ncbi:MAG: hypothetical protein AAFT19_11625, partial [Pseudomonadota bacterium]
VMHDFISRPGHELTPKRMGLYGRITTLVMMVLAVLWAPQIATFPGLFAYLQQAFSIVVPPVIAIFLFGVFSRAGAGNAAVITLATGHALGLALFLAGEAGLWDVHFTINVGIMTAVSAAVFLIVAAREPRISDERADRTTWRVGGRGEAEGDLPIYARPTIQGAAILAVTAVMLLAFW